MPAANGLTVPLDGLSAGTVSFEDFPGMKHFIVHTAGQIPSLASFGKLRDLIGSSSLCAVRNQERRPFVSGL